MGGHVLPLILDDTKAHTSFFRQLPLATRPLFTANMETGICG